MTDEERRRAVGVPEVRGGRHQVGDIRGKVGVGELAFARADAGEIEAQNGDAVLGQALGNAGRGKDVLAAGKTVREQREGDRLVIRAIEACRQTLPVAAGERDGSTFTVAGYRLPTAQ